MTQLVAFLCSVSAFAGIVTGVTTGEVYLGLIVYGSGLLTTTAVLFIAAVVLGD